MGKEVSVGGPASRDDVQVRTELTDVNIGMVKVLESKVGVAHCTVAYQYLNAQRVAYGATHAMTGVLKGVELPDISSDGNEVGMIEVTISSDEVAA
jgi:hypothetical protein